MKKFLKVATIWHLVFFVTGSGHLIAPEVYIEKIAQRVSRIIQPQDFCGKLFPLEDFDLDLNQSQYGLIAQGIVSFQSGFVQSIESVNLRAKPKGEYGYINDNEAGVKAIYSLNGVKTVHDVQLKLTNFTGNGVLIVAWKDVSFEFRVMRQHSTKKVTAIAEFGATNQGGQYKMEVQSYPKSDYMQLLVKQFRGKVTSREKIVHSMQKDWTANLQIALQRASEEIPFPMIKYGEE